MNARTFFSVTKAGRIEKQKSYLGQLYDLCEITEMQHYTPQFSNDLKKRYNSQVKKLNGITGYAIQTEKGHVLDSASPEVAAILFDAFRQKKRLMGIRSDG